METRRECKLNAEHHIIKTTENGGEHFLLPPSLLASAKRKPKNTLPRLDLLVGFGRGLLSARGAERKAIPDKTRELRPEVVVWQRLKALLYEAGRGG